MGKDTVAKMIADWAVGRTAIMGFADALKRSVAEVYDFSEEQMFGPSSERNKPDTRYPRADGTFMAPRDPLMSVGTEGYRAAWEPTWRHKTFLLARKCVVRAGTYDRFRGLMPGSWVGGEEGAPYEHVVIADGRFLDELSQGRDEGAKLLRVARPGVPVNLSHASESSMAAIPDSYFDAVLRNAGGLPEVSFLVRDTLIGWGMKVHPTLEQE
jgi:hypothetical protein